MANISTADIEVRYAEVLRQATALGIDTDDWLLVHGNDAASPRSQWVIATNGTDIRLGYTKREVLSALTAQVQLLWAMLANN